MFVEDHETNEPVPQPETQEYAYPLEPILNELVRGAGTSSYTYGKDLEAAIMGYAAFRRNKGLTASFAEILSSLKPNTCAVLVDFLTLNKTPNERSDVLSGILHRRHRQEDPTGMIPEAMEGMDRITIDQMLSSGEGVLRSALASSLDRELAGLSESRRQGQLMPQGRINLERYSRMVNQLRASAPPRRGNPGSAGPGTGK